MSKKGQYWMWMCECSDYHCVLQVSLPQRVTSEVVKNEYDVIIDGCTTPLPEGATLIRQCEGYKIYKFADE